MKLVFLNFKNEAGFRVAFLISQGSLFCCFSVKVWRLAFPDFLALFPSTLALDFPLTLSLLSPCPAHLFLLCRRPRAASRCLWVLGPCGSLPPLKMLQITLYNCVGIKMNILKHFLWPQSAFFLLILKEI